MKTVIQLGRIGDIINILPLARRDFEQGNKWRLMVAAEYAPLLEGCSYVEPLIFNGPHYAISDAVAQAKGQSSELVCCQVNGPVDQVRTHTYNPAGRGNAISTSFQKESWSVLGRLKEWDEDYPLVFDRRSPEREAALVAKVLPPRRGKPKKLMLVSLKGNSSPFPYGDLLMTLLQLKFPNWNILELPAAERFFDLLGLYERAQALVATDSAPLQLARACPSLPVVALANDKPLLWNGSAWQPNHIWYCRYSDFPQRAPGMLSALELIDQFDGWVGHYGNIVHVWNAYEPTDFHVPFSEAWVRTPITPGMAGRDSGMMGDEKRHPMLKDCIRMGLRRVYADGYLCVSRDVTIQPEFIDFSVPASYAYRFVRNGEGDIFKPVVDMFLAKKSWWKAHLAEIPDYIFGSDYYWTNGLWALFRKHGAIDDTGCCYREAKAKA